jgi:hypothetical protein
MVCSLGLRGLESRCFVASLCGPESALCVCRQQPVMCRVLSHTSRCSISRAQGFVIERQQLHRHERLVHALLSSLFACLAAATATCECGCL